MAKTGWKRSIGKGKRRESLYSLALILLLALSCGTAAAAEEIASGTLVSGIGNHTGISNHTGIALGSAQIDGDRFVRAESISAPRFLYNMYLYNITTGKETLVSPLSPGEPPNEFIGGVHPLAISENHITWIKNENVWVSETATGKNRAVTSNSDDFHATVARWDPAISGDVIVWKEENWSRLRHMPRIMAHNLTTGVTRVVVEGDWDKTNIGIAGSRIVWEDSRKDGIDRDIWLYDLSTGEERAVCNASGTQFDPKISGDRIVWSDNRDGNFDVYMFDIPAGTETVIATGIADQEGAVISGDRIVWMEYSSTLLNNPYDESNRLMMYDLSSGKEYQLLRDIPEISDQEISGNRIIFMDLANIPAGERENRHEDTVQEISLFTLDPVVFPLPVPTAEAEATGKGRPVRSPEVRPPVPAITHSPGFSTAGVLTAMVIGVLFGRVCKGVNRHD